MADQAIQDIKDRLDVAEVIGSYITVKKTGISFKAICPFHAEKTPSLVISPAKQIWHCFGCGEGGDVFGFVMRYENLDFPEALHLLADRAGVELPKFQAKSGPSADREEILRRINDFASRFYHEVLLKQKPAEGAREYLKNRQLTDGTINKWLIGFAPGDFHAIQQALLQKQVILDDALLSGLLSKNERGQVYDRFRNRITFPIFDYYGQVVGFSARTLSGDDKEAKYINSPETPIYNKSRILFGLNFAKQAIRKANEVVVVEGQMDVISTHQAGFENTVASSGTALTEGQVTLLRRLTQNIKFCFDADSAGSMATRRGGELALRKGFRVKIITLPRGKDPDELVRQSPGSWQKAVSQAVWFIDFYLDQASRDFAANSVEQKQHVSSEIVPLLAFITDALEQDHYVRQIAERFGVGERAIRTAMRQAPSQSKPAGPLQESLPAGHGTLLVEKQVLGGMLKFPEFRRQVLAEGAPEDFSSAEIRALVVGPLDATATVAKEAEFMLESQLEVLDGKPASLQHELLKSFYFLRVQALKRTQKELSEQLKAAEQRKDAAVIQRLNQEFIRVSDERMNFENKL